MIRFRNKEKTVVVTLVKGLKYTTVSPVMSMYTVGRWTNVGSRCNASNITENILFEMVEISMGEKECVNASSISKYIPEKYDVGHTYRIIAWSEVK